MPTINGVSNLQIIFSSEKKLQKLAILNGITDENSDDTTGLIDEIISLIDSVGGSTSEQNKNKLQLITIRTLLELIKNIQKNLDDNMEISYNNVTYLFQNAINNYNNSSNNKINANSIICDVVRKIHTFINKNRQNIHELNKHRYHLFDYGSDTDSIKKVKNTLKQLEDSKLRELDTPPQIEFYDGVGANVLFKPNGRLDLNNSMFTTYNTKVFTFVTNRKNNENHQKQASHIKLRVNLNLVAVTKEEDKCPIIQDIAYLTTCFFACNLPNKFMALKILKNDQFKLPDPRCKDNNQVTIYLTNDVSETMAKKIGTELDKFIIHNLQYNQHNNYQPNKSNFEYDCRINNCYYVSYRNEYRSQDGKVNLDNVLITTLTQNYKDMQKFFQSNKIKTNFPCDNIKYNIIKWYDYLDNKAQADLLKKFPFLNSTL